MNKNALVLAYLGDSIYETYIRKYLIDKGISKVNDLQKEAIDFVSAKSQATFLKMMQESNFLTLQENNVVTNARNHKNNHKPKNCDILTYKHATALEALIGYLYYEGNFKRINEIMDYIIKTKCV